jgi:muramidase (phage lysozyme)
MVLTFSSYSRHPGARIYLNETLSSTAAGRYQILAKIWRAYRGQLNLKGFFPEAQDKIALQLISECKAGPDIESGKVESAISKCRSRWASLTGAGYGQHEHKMQDLLQAYTNEGGLL